MLFTQVRLPLPAPHKLKNFGGGVADFVTATEDKHCGSDGKESACDEGDLGSIPGAGKIPWRREWLPTPELLPREFHGPEGPGGLQSMGLQSWTQLSD